MKKFFVIFIIILFGISLFAGGYGPGDGISDGPSDEIAFGPGDGIGVGEGIPNGPGDAVCDVPNGPGDCIPNNWFIQN